MHRTLIFVLSLAVASAASAQTRVVPVEPCEEQIFPYVQAECPPPRPAIVPSVVLPQPVSPLVQARPVPPDAAMTTPAVPAPASASPAPVEAPPPATPPTVAVAAPPPASVAVPEPLALPPPPAPPVAPASLPPAPPPPTPTRPIRTAAPPAPRLIKPAAKPKALAQAAPRPAAGRVARRGYEEWWYEPETYTARRPGRFYDDPRPGWRGWYGD